jgi:cullin 3
MIGKAITLFRFIAEKDVFEQYYKVHLAKRLLQGRSVSDDAERGMLAKLRIECGLQFTVKIEGMFHDMKLSVDTMQAYGAHLGRATVQLFTLPSQFWSNPSNMQVCDININVTVLTSTFWPIPYSPSPCMFPPLLFKARKSFEQFYHSRYSGRKLTWQPSLGSADVRVTFKARKHDLNVSSFALIILLLFENLGEGEYLTYEEIKNATAIPDSELQRNLQSLACSTFQVLRKHPSGRDVNSRDSFSFNADFSSPLQKIMLKVFAAQSEVENGEEHKETQGRIDEERRYQTDVSTQLFPRPDEVDEPHKGMHRTNHEGS